MFGLSKLYLYAILALAWAVSVLGVGVWQRWDGRADLTREIEAAASEKALEDLKAKGVIDNEVESTDDSNLRDLIPDGWWVREEN
jgi:hypothetical protein